MRFDFGVVDHDCEDQVQLFDTHVVYNGVRRGRLHTDARPQARPSAPLAAVCVPGPVMQAPPVSVQMCMSASPAPAYSPSAPPMPPKYSPTAPSGSPPRAAGAPAPPMSQPASAPFAAYPLPVGAKIFLRSATSGRNIRINDNGTVDANGGNGALATFVVAPSNGYLRLQNLKHPDRFLAIRDGYLTYGTGGLDCEFFAKSVGAEQFVLRAVHCTAGVGFLPDGRPTMPMQTMEDAHAQFIVSYA